MSISVIVSGEPSTTVNAPAGASNTISIGQDLSDFVKKSQTGAFYPASNPSGFVLDTELSGIENITGELDSRVTTNANNLNSLQLSNSLSIGALNLATGFLDTGVSSLQQKTGSYVTNVDLSGLESATGDLKARIESNDDDIYSNVLGLIQLHSQTGKYFRTVTGNVLPGFDVSGDVKVSGALEITENLTIPGRIIHKDDPNTFIDFEALDSFSITTQGNENFHIGPAGNVGIGTNPSNKLHVLVSGNPTALKLQRNTVSDDTNVNILFTDGSSNGWYAGKASNNRFGIGTNANLGNNAKFIVDNTGNVGVGTTLPQAKLHVDGGVIISGDVSEGIFIHNLPTSDPGVVNQLYNDGGTLKISMTGDTKSFIMI